VAVASREAGLEMAIDAPREVRIYALRIMLRELTHFAWHAPATLRLKARLPQEQLYETVMDRADAAGLAARRADLVADLRGDVLELGSGTGRMFPHYDRGARVAAVEPDARFAALAETARAEAAATISSHVGTGEALPFEAARFDAAVLALVLCSVASPGAVLAEVRRVLRPGGRLRLLEHVRSERAVAGWLMDRVDGAWLRLNAQGCHLNRDPIPALVDAGFRIEREDRFQVFSAGLPAFPMRAIHAIT
jgi:SAM-dependent methyltransferase